ncbi:MAG: hypothetical protein MIL41_10300 [Hyphomicrobiales bacterium]
MRLRLALVILLAASPAAARGPRLPQRPVPAGLLAGQPITPGGLLIRDGERLRTLELDELAALRVAWTVRF